MENAIEVNGLSRTFNDHAAVDQLSFNVPRGQIFGLLGPNAAGKSTTIRMLSGIIRVDAGSAKVLNFDLQQDVEQIKARIGYVAQEFALYPELTVLENLSFYANIYSRLGKAEKMALLETYGLTAMVNKRAGLLSGGYKRRLSIACAMAHDPELIFLDEPTAGIDPVTRKELWEQFYALAAAGKTLFVTTHYMEEAERCHQLAFLHHGKLVASGSPSSMVQSFTDYAVYNVPISHHPEFVHALEHLKGLLVINQFGEEMRLIADDSLELESLDNLLKEHGFVEISAQKAQPTIEDVFITYTREVKAS